MDDLTTRSESARRLPGYLHRPIHHGPTGQRVRKTLRDLSLATVCEAARCPNTGECFQAGTATFLILGDVCTRRCRFCAVTKGTPHTVDPDEPARVAAAVDRLGLTHTVITSVTRDDLADGGLSHFVRTLEMIARRTPGTTAEALVPDFAGRTQDIESFSDTGLSVFNHNVETVPRLYASIRPGASYGGSLALLSAARERLSTRVKSGLMVGLGETHEEVDAVLSDLVDAGVQVVTIGQYLQPIPSAHPTIRFYHPDEYERWIEHGARVGLDLVIAGPFVRSSYHAADVMRSVEESNHHST